jgi:hypothetical protein
MPIDCRFNRGRSSLSSVYVSGRRPKQPVVASESETRHFALLFPSPPVDCLRQVTS